MQPLDITKFGPRSKEAVFTQLQKLEFEILIERAIIIFSGFVLVLNAYFNLRTHVVSTQNHVNHKKPQAKITFSHPVSRLIVSTHSSPQHKFTIDWERPSFRDTMYREMILETDGTLLPNQEYLVLVKGVRTIDRLKKLPLEVILKTSEFNPEDKENFSYIDEGAEKYVYMNEYSDYVRLVEKD